MRRVNALPPLARQKTTRFKTSHINAKMSEYEARPDSVTAVLRLLCRLPNNLRGSKLASH